MLVKERMSYPVITVQPEAPILEALNLMRKERVRRFPVVDNRGRLVGIVTQTDLLHASPSDATSLSIWEVNYLVSKITVEDVMSHEVINIAEDTPLEEAARIMVENKIGGLPVLREDKVIGIITETDLFKIFLEMLGARDPGIRLAVLVPNVTRDLAQLTNAIFDAGGNILALSTFLGESSDNREVVLKVEGVSPDVLEGAIQPFVERTIDLRDVLSI